METLYDNLPQAETVSKLPGLDSSSRGAPTMATLMATPYTLLLTCYGQLVVGVLLTINASCQIADFQQMQKPMGGLPRPRGSKLGSKSGKWNVVDVDLDENSWKQSRS